MKIIVTGALGYIGSRLIREIAGAFPNADIFALDNLYSQRYSSLFNLPIGGRYRFIEADVCKADLKNYFRGADVVVHLAAITNLSDGVEFTDRILENNFNGTKKVAEACVEAGSALIFFSTTSVYAHPNGACFQNPYVDSKIRSEDCLKKLGEEQNLRFLTLRCGTVFGVSPGMGFHTAINKFCWQAVTEKPLSVWRTALHQKRPYLGLTDAVRAVMFLIEKKIFDGTVYDVVSVHSTVSEVVEMISEIIPHLSVELVDSTLMNSLSFEAVPKGLNQLGFEFKDTLSESIHETIDLFKGIARGQMPNERC